MTGPTKTVLCQRNVYGQNSATVSNRHGACRERGNEATFVQIPVDGTRPFMAEEPGKEESRL
jgi:hypothetical protein